MLIPTLLAGLLLSSGPSAPPDTFWLETGARAGVEGSSPRSIEGVLLDQDEDFYHLRVEGGELWLAKAQVVKIDKNSTTVAAIEAAEKQAHAQRTAAAKAAELARRAAAEAAALAEPAAASEAVFSGVVLDDVTAAPAETTRVREARHFDPVLGAVRGGHEIGDARLLRDLELAYQLTHDRSYLKLLRKLRRLR